MKRHFPIALAITLAVALALSPHAAAAQDYPTRPIKIIVGFAPGGGVDTVARLVGQEMSKALGQSVVIENRPGAAGTIGATAAARSEPDGYTLVMFPGGHPLYGATHKSLPFDTVTSFEWISTVVTLQFLALVRAEAKYQSLAELIAAAKAAPETITYASAGVGSTHHLTIEMIANRAGAKFLHVPYQGDAPALGALLADQVQFTLATPTQAIGSIQGGKVRALAVTGNTRMPGVPDAPTVEQAPQRGSRKALATPEVRAKLEQIGGEVRPSSSQEFRDRVARELAMWIKVVDDIKLPRQ